MAVRLPVAIHRGRAAGRGTLCCRSSASALRRQSRRPLPISMGGIAHLNTATPRQDNNDERQDLNNEKTPAEPPRYLVC
jgi:hypothetical protein